MSEEVVELYCPACGVKMHNVIYIAENKFEFPEKQCPQCRTVYQLASDSQTETKTAQEIILIPHKPEWMKENWSSFKGLLKIKKKNEVKKTNAKQ